MATFVASYRGEKQLSHIQYCDRFVAVIQETEYYATAIVFRVLQFIRADSNVLSRAIDGESELLIAAQRDDT